MHSTVRTVLVLKSLNRLLCAGIGLLHHHHHHYHHHHIVVTTTRPLRTLVLTRPMLDLICIPQGQLAQEGAKDTVQVKADGGSSSGGCCG